MAAMKLLGMTFHASEEAARATCRAVLDKAEKRIEVVHHFKLSLTERAYVMKACVSTALYYVVRIASPPRYANVS